MIAHVIHDPNRTDRFVTLQKEAGEQGFPFKLFPALKAEPPYKGISLAHKQIVQYALDQNLDEVLIMEDDVRFCGPGSFRYFLDNRPSEFDLYLAGVYFGVLTSDNTVKQFSGLHCYIVHKRFYDTFLKIDPEQHLDFALTGKGLYKVCNPFAAIQYNGFSDNVKKEADYDNLLRGRKLFNNYDLCNPTLKFQPGKTGSGT